MRYRAPWWKSLVRLIACSTCSGPHRAESNGRQCQGQKERGKLTSCQLPVASCQLHVMVHHTESITESQRQPVTVLPLCFFFVSSSIRASWASSQDPKERHIDRRGRHTMMLTSAWKRGFGLLGVFFGLRVLAGQICRAPSPHLKPQVYRSHALGPARAHFDQGGPGCVSRDG